MPKKFWTRLVGSVVIQRYVGECTPRVDRALQAFSPLHKQIIVRAL